MNALLLLVAVFILQQVNGFGFNRPNGILYKEVNSTIRIQCTVDLNDDQSEGLNSSYLSFRLSNDVNREEVRILNASTIEMTIPNAPPQELMATCYLRTHGVDMTRVYVGYKPKPVRNFRCVSYNWENMKCSFERSSNPVASRYELTYYLIPGSPQTNLCPLSGDYNRTYWCNMGFGSTTALYRMNYQYYYFILTSTNDLGVLTENFTIDHYGIVIPDPVEGLKATKITTDSAVIEWKIPYHLKHFPNGITHLINYTSEFSNGVWKQLYISSEHKKEHQLDNEMLLENLEFANVWYDVRVSTQVHNATYKNVWSNFTSITFRTLSRRPDEPPEVDGSGFNVDDNGNIYLYWQEIPNSKKNGNNPTYNITIEHGAPSFIRPNITTNTMAKFDRMNFYMHNDLIFLIRSANDDGNSQEASVIVVPKVSRRLKPPMQIKKILHYRVYELSWKAPPFSDDIESYTVFWCATKNEFLNQCDGSINYARVGNDVTSFTHSSNETLNFAVASNSKVSSSGMVWARCTAGSINDIGKLSTIWIAKIESTSIEFKWTLECVDQAIVNGFNLSYCPIKDPKTEDCKEGTERYIDIAKSDSFGYTLTDLTPYTTYKTVISMYSFQRASPGPPSEPLINTTLEAVPSPPRNLEYSNVTDTSVTLHWDIPEHINGVLMKYTVWYNSNVKEVDKQHITPNMTYTLTGLNSFTKYDICVKAHTFAESNRSNIVTIETKVGNPGNITTLTLPEAGDEVSLEWGLPVQKNGKLDYYEVQMVNKIGDYESEYISSHIREQHCTYTFNRCEPGVDRRTFRVRAVNVVNSPFDSHRIDRHELGGYNAHACKEAYNHQDSIYVDKHATILAGNWSTPIYIVCNTPEYARGGWYMLWAFIFIVGCGVAFLSFLMMKKFKKMKDIGVELPAGLEDIKQDAKTKGLSSDSHILPRQENTKQNHYSAVPNEQEQGLLWDPRVVRSGQGTDNNFTGPCEYNKAVDYSESEQQNDDDSTAETISESLDLTKSSPTPLMSMPKLSPLKKDPIIVPAIGPTNIPLSSNNYISEAFLRSPPAAAPVPITSNGYVSHDAIVRPSAGYTSWTAATRPFVPSVEETKVKTPVVATTDIQGISGYVTHKQLSDFGQLIQ